MGRVLAIIGGVLVLALLAGGLTEATLAIGHHGGIVDDVSLRPLKATPVPSATPKSTPSPTPSLAATPTPAVTPAAKTARTSSFVRMRAGKSTSTAILYELQGNTVVTLMPEVTPEWQQVQYGGQTGYIYKSYLIY